jgi:putative endonuclease
MKYYTYIAKCSDGSLYTGYCKDIFSREKRHNEGKGAKYTRSRRPVSIIYHEVYNTISEAMIREKEIKKFSRKNKEELIMRFKNN